MKVGINNISQKATEMVAGAVLAEELGYDSVWYGEHILLPRHVQARVQPQPYGPQEFFDVFALLAGLGAKTSRIRLGTGIAILPLRPPVLAARQMLAVDHVSRGRLDVAVGLGWCQDEYDAAGIPMKGRGARMDEQLELINKFFQPGDTEHEGRFYRVAKTAFDPKPVQTPRPPFLVGGASEAALRRAARWDGWYGVVDSLDEFRRDRDRIEAFRREYGREGAPFEYVLVFHQGLSCKGAPSRETIESYLAEGCDRVVVTPWGYDHDAALPRIAEYAREIGLGGLEA